MQLRRLTAAGRRNTVIWEAVFNADGVFELELRHLITWARRLRDDEALLKPLREFLHDNGAGEGAIADVADRYGVSEWRVLTTLVNRRAIDRDRLPRR